MFIQLRHKSLNVYDAVRELTKEIYKASMSVKLNLEGCTRRSATERKRYFEVSRGSVVEIDAALETAVDLNYFKIEGLKNIGELLNKCFLMLSKMIS